MTATIVTFKTVRDAHQDQLLDLIDQLRDLVASGEITQMVAGFIHPNGSFGTARACDGGDYRLIGVLELMKQEVSNSILDYEDDLSDG